MSSTATTPRFASPMTSRPTEAGPASQREEDASASRTAVMQAITYSRFGSPDVLALSERPKPVAGRGQVLVEVRASSVNVIDSRARQGIMWPFVDRKFPKTPGSELAGVVAAVGAGVTGFQVGDAVFGTVGSFKGGAFAQFAAVPAGDLAPIPKGVSFEDAAALPLAGLAALQALRDLGKATAGTQILFHGASGGMGLYAIQIAKQLGAHITAVASTGGVETMRALGADVVIDYTKTDGAAFDRQFDVIVNASGKLPYAKARRFLRRGGRMIEPSPFIPVVIGSAIANPFRREKHLMLMTKANRADLDQLAAGVVSGALRTTIAKVYPLAEAKAAFTAQEKGGVVGKLVVRVR